MSNAIGNTIELDELKGLAGDVIREAHGTVQDARTLVKSNANATTLNTASRAGETFAQITKVMVENGLVGAI